jgi:hypothetical protein
MNLEITQRSTVLTAPAISPQHLHVQGFVRTSIKPQPRSIQEKESTDGKTHPSLELLAGNGEFGYRGRVESTECVRAGVTNAVNKGAICLFHDLLQSEPLTVLSRHGLGGLRLV